MRVFPATRRRVAATFAASALVAASAVSFAPGAPADERVLDSDERFAVIGAQTLPLADQDAVVVADLDGYFRAQLLAVLLGDEASALDVTQLVGGPVSDDGDALDGDDDVLEGGDDVLEGDEDALEGDDALEDLVTTVREADAVVVVDRAWREDEVLLPAAQDDVRADEETPDPALPAECRASVVAWLAGLGTPAVVVTDRAAPAETDDGEAGGEVVQSPPSVVAPSATSTPSSPPDDDDDAPAGPDVVFVLEPTAGAAAVAAVLTGISEATGVVPEASPLDSAAGEAGMDGDEPSACPELPDPGPAPESDASDPPPDPAPGPSPDESSEPSPDEIPDPDGTPDPDSSPDPNAPDEDAPGTEDTDADAPDVPETDGPTPDGPQGDAPGQDGPDVGDPEAPAPRIPELDGPPAPGPPPALGTPELGDQVDRSKPAPWRLPVRKPAGDPLALSVAPGGLTLSDVTIDGDLVTLTGQLPGVTVVDHRKGKAQGWTLSAQVSDLEGPAVLPASQLGWTPRVYGDTAVAGPAVVPALSGGPGLAGAAVLGTAPRGTADAPVELDAAVVLETTRDAAPGQYAGVITLTLFPTE